MAVRRSAGLWKGTRLDYQINCDDCGTEHVARRKNVRYCGVCRMFRNLVYLGNRKAKCSSCETKFAPLTANDQLCASCDFLSESNPKGACAFCSSVDVPLIHPELAVCLACGKDATIRSKVTAAIGKKRRARQTTNDKVPS